MKRERNEDLKSIQWSEIIRAKYLIDIDDFTTKYPGGIIVYRASTKPPEVVYENGFSPVETQVWIEDSGYLLKDVWARRNYVENQINTYGRMAIPMPNGEQLLMPGSNTGTVSTTLTPKKAFWYCAGQFLEEIAKQLTSHVPNRSPYFLPRLADQQKQALYQSAQSGAPIGYIYAVRISCGLNISKHFQWAEFPDPDMIEEEIAVEKIAPEDVLAVRPLQVQLDNQKKGFDCVPGDIILNKRFSRTIRGCDHVEINDICQTLQDKVNNTSDDAAFFDENILLFVAKRSFSTILPIPQLGGAFRNTTLRKDELKLNESEFSRSLIAPFIAKTQKEYLEKLKERLRKAAIVDNPENDKDGSRLAKRWETGIVETPEVQDNEIVHVEVENCSNKM